MQTKIKENPKTNELFNFINESLAKRAYLTLIAKCRVKCCGKSFRLADRLIMIKPDGAIIVDDVQDLEPLCSLPPGSKFEAKIENEIIYFMGFNENMAKSIELEVYKGYLATYHVYEF